MIGACDFQNTKIPSSKAETIFYLMGNLSSIDSQMMGIVIQSKNKTLVIDSGTTAHANQLFLFLKERANLHVDA